MSRAPQVNRETQFFWEGIEQGEFRIQRCVDCSHLRFPPRPMCPECQSLEWDAQRASGRGTVYSYVKVHRPHPEEFSDGYLVALLELEEGIRFVSNPIDTEVTELEIGARVHLRIVEVEPGVRLPQFELV